MHAPLRTVTTGESFARYAVPVGFIVGGIGMLYWVSTQVAPTQGLGGILPYAVAAAFIISGARSLYLVRRQRVRADEARRQLEANRDHPWRVRPQWREGELVAPSPVDRSFLLFTIAWNVVSWPIALLILSTPQEGPAWLVLLFPVAGLAMVAKILADYRRGARFGRTTVVLEPYPPRLGEGVRGTLRTERGGETIFEKGVLLRVSCYRQYVRRSRDSDGDRRRTVERDLLWRDEARIPVGSGVGGVDVPFSFEIPPDQPPSNPLELEQRILWEVSAEADIPGLDFETAIEIPVFPPTPEMLRERLEAKRARAVETTDSAPASDPSEGGVAESAKRWPFVSPITEGIELVERPGSLELNFTATRNRKGAWILGFAGVVAAALGIFVLTHSFLWGLGLLALAALTLYGTIQQATNDTTLTIRDGRIEVTHDGIGMPGDAVLPVANLQGVEVHLGAGTGTNRSYSLTLIAATNVGLEEVEDQAYRTANILAHMGVSDDHPAMEAILDNAERPRILVANQLEDKEEADWLAYKIREAARRQADA